MTLADRPVRHDPARRHPARGTRPLAGRQAQDRAPPRRGRLPVHRGRLARLEPEGRGVLRGGAQHDLPARQAGRIRIDPPSLEPRRGRSEPSRAARGGDAGHDHLRQELAPPRRRRAGRHAGREPGDDRRVGGLPARRRTRGRLRRRALLRRLQGRCGLRHRHPARRRRRPARRRWCCATPTAAASPKRSPP